MLRTLQWFVVASITAVAPNIGYTQADSLDDLSARTEQLYRKGEYSKAATIAERALALIQKEYGPEHPRVGKALNELAFLYHTQGRYPAAIPLYKRSLAIFEKALGPDHPNVGWSLNNLAGLYQSQGRYAEAEILFKRSQVIREKALGPEHRSVGQSLNNIALLYVRQGRYADAQLLYKRSLAIFEKALGPEHPEVAMALNNLADLYSEQGRYAEAETLFQRSQVIREKALGPEHRSVGLSLNNLAALYVRQGRYDDAEPLYMRSLAIFEKALGPEHPSIATLLNNLALLYEYQGAFAAAEPYYRRSLAIRQKALGPGHSLVATSLNNLALLYEKQGRYAIAEPVYQRSLTINEKALGPEHPSVARTLNNLAAHYVAQGNWARATEYFRRSTEVVATRTRRGAQIIGKGLTGNRKTEAMQSNLVFRRLVKSAYRLAQRKDKASEQMGAEMFNVAQWAAGSGAAASLAKMAARQAAGNARLAVLVRERQDLVDEWQKRDAARSAAVAKPPSKRNKQLEEKNVTRLGTIDQRIMLIDRRLAADFPDYAALANPEPAGITEVQKWIKANEALVLFLDTVKWKPTPEETFIWVVTKTQSRWVRNVLGTKGLRDRVNALRCGLDFEGAWRSTRCFDLLKTVYTATDRYEGKALPFSLTRSYALYESLFGQIEDLIQDKGLLIVPSGALTQLPFQVLLTKKPWRDQPTRDVFAKAPWLAKSHAITVLPSVASLKALRAHAKSSTAAKPFTGFANPLLDGSSGWHRKAAKEARSIKGCAATQNMQTAALRSPRAPVMPLGRGSRLADLNLVRHQTPLPETADELCAVARTAGADAVDIHLGQKASETVIKDLSASGKLASYRVLHFATHGALAGELQGSNEPGLILTPPEKATARDDGYLSASEVAGLKLNADWVILSACNTAAGESENAEALSGLAKAFFYAGARSLLVSHWYVDSHATVALITKAFDVLKRDPSVGRSGALRKAMLSLIKSDGRFWHPAYWAPFVVVGEGGG